jgi:hypothetical protein
MPTDSKADLATYLAANKTPDPAVVAAWEKAIALEAAAGPGVKPPAVNSGPERSTAQFLSDELRDEMARRNKTEADAYLAAAPFDADAHEQHRKEIFGRFQLGSMSGSTSVNGDLP